VTLHEGTAAGKESPVLEDGGFVEAEEVEILE
jgi:hypothetical protein